ncbi:MAG TPA: pyridoxamine 5'-phosphate oxidase [Acidimicrobiia bacterium]|nr:pyridoxamine 5'-phosphate oxidase [Acidimicrobiia bacterium]
MIGEEAARLRREYEAEGLVESDMAADPITQFRHWFDGVISAGIDEPNAFVLATTDADGSPSARAVLMKDVSSEGIVFYTGLGSRKSRALRENRLAAATFVWTPLHRQVRFEGTVDEVDSSTADEYFASRPRGAQIAAHASRQSEVVADRESLERRYQELDESFGGVVPRPENWGGWRLAPESVEFWQGRPNRFHDRIRYYLQDGVWMTERLAP